MQQFSEYKGVSKLSSQPLAAPSPLGVGILGSGPVTQAIHLPSLARLRDILEVLSTAIFAFLLAWNDYLVAIVFLRSNEVFTLPMGVQSFFQQNQTDWTSVMALAVIMMLPPVIVFATLNKYFSVGGIGGSLAGR